MAIALLALVLLGFSADTALHIKKDTAALSTISEETSEKLIQQSDSPLSEASIEYSETNVTAASTK